VDTEAVAIECVKYMRTQHAGRATFIPLDTIITKPINESVRSVCADVYVVISLWSDGWIDCCVNVVMFFKNKKNATFILQDIIITKPMCVQSIDNSALIVVAYDALSILMLF
jgi:chromosome segregation ATPase